MNRKILQAGPSTLAISLPTCWVKKFNLKKGQELAIEEQGNSLRIKTSNTIEEESAVINASELYPVSTRIIGMLYRSGYKKIKAFYTPNKVLLHRGKQLKELDMIKETFDHLIGMQLWDIGKDSKGYFTTVKESAKVNSMEFENILNKLFFHLIHQSEQAYDSLINNKDLFDEAYQTERLINQAQDFCIRILFVNGHENYKKTIHYAALIYRLESMGDNFFKILLNNHQKREKTDKFSLQYLKELTGLINESSSINRKFDFNKIKALSNKLKKSKDEYEEKIRKGQIKQSIISINIYAILIELSELIESLYLLNHEYFKETALHF